MTNLTIAELKAQESRQVQADIDKLDAADGKIITLSECGSWGQALHCFEPDSPEISALIAAVASRRPLLISSEPGVGKSSAARAAAAVLGRRFISAVVQPDTEYSDLLWNIDHTQRLADAQLSNKDQLNDMTNYIAPGSLWWAYDWTSAAKQYKKCGSNFKPHTDSHAPDAETAGVVLLVDEIDKADISLANGLLEVLGNGGFDVPTLESNTVKPALGQHHPLVILTSNDSRELPPALLRRCVNLRVELPTGEEYHRYLKKIGEAHFPSLKDGILDEAAKQIIQDRNNCPQLPRTGLAEYLDLLRAVASTAANTQEQHQWLKKLAPYFKKSNVEML